jgi:hypothetical protein
MDGTTPGALKSDAWIIRQNALRLLAAMRAIVDRFGTSEAANLVCRIESRIETGLSDDAVGLTAVDGVGASRAKTLSAAGYRTPADLLAAGADRLAAAGLKAGVAERVVESAGDLPAIEVEWGAFPESIAAGERDMREVTVRTTAGGARAGIRVTVNGTEMTRKDCYLGETTVPVAVFGAADELVLAIRVTFPDLPLPPVEETRTVSVTD